MSSSIKNSNSSRNLNGNYRNSNGMFLAVLPAYRTECIEMLIGESTSDVHLYVSDAHLDSSVRTGIPAHLYQRMPMIRLFGKRAFIQLSPTIRPLIVSSLVVDLNPRSLSAWFLLVIRRLLGRRTLVWGHINPQRGATSRTAGLRQTMRRLSSGTICYTYDDAEYAVQALSGSDVWVAPNSLYRSSMIRAGCGLSPRRNVIYVGRFEPAKKVPLLVTAFAKAVVDEPQMRLVLVGGGSQDSLLRSLVKTLGIESSVDFVGWVEEFESLDSIYEQAFCSVSAGFAGLGLTQSLGFGVPVIVADKEPHSPEIELESSGGVTWFTSDSTEDLSQKIIELWKNSASVPNADLTDHVRSYYSAERMATGLLSAMNNLPGGIGGPKVEKK